MSKVTIIIAEDDDELVHKHEINTVIPELLRWWVETAISDFTATTGKIEEYGLGDGSVQGSADLRAIGAVYGELLGWAPDTDPALLQELACWTYGVGKFGRCISNYQKCEPAKPDTLFDTNVYMMMARRIQETGNWP